MVNTGVLVITSQIATMTNWDLISPEFWDRLRGAFRTSDALHAWLQRPNVFLGGRTPAEAIEAGQTDQIVAALRALDSRQG